MGRIIYKKGSILEAPKGSVIVHAVNCQGVWGSGVAKLLKDRFPGGFQAYKHMCDYARGEDFTYISYASSSWEDTHLIANLYTSVDYGPKVDPPDQILRATHHAVANLLAFERKGFTNINSPKFNSGLFKTPWEKTERIIEDALVWYPEVSWTVWEP